MKKYPLLFFCAVLLSFLLNAQTPTQVIRGTVVDADNSRPLPGASVILPGTDPVVGTVTGNDGGFLLSGVPAGRYQLQVSYVGYETLVVAELNVASGKEVVQHVQLYPGDESLNAVVVKAPGIVRSSHPLSLHTLTVEEQFRFPTTYYDPARLATALPGVAATNDQANIMSVRGNAPGTVRWRLEGVDIVNPNHTANAGTASDRPTTAGGGVNILSAQVLGTSGFLTGAFPASYGNSVGSVLDMYFRDGNDREHEFVAQAGLIGLEMAAEGPLGDKKDDAAGGASYLVNYRYSFVGLLTSMGVDFGGEEINFQDISFNVAIPTGKAGKFTLFGLGGKSKNLFRSPGDTAVLTEEKERFDIDFRSMMGALGMSHETALGRRSSLRSVVTYSALEHEWESDMVVGESASIWVQRDTQEERKLAISSVFSHRLGSHHLLRLGFQASREEAEFLSQFVDRARNETFTGGISGWLLQPYADWEVNLHNRWRFNAGLHLTHFTADPANKVIEPRASVTYMPGSSSALSLAYGLHSQIHSAQVYSLPTWNRHGLGFLRSHHLLLGYRQQFDRRRVFRAEAYYQHLFNVPVSDSPGSSFSVLNMTEFYRPAGGYYDPVSNRGTGRNYGLDIMLQQYMSGNIYYLLGGSVYRSQYTDGAGIRRSTRWDGRYLLNLTGGKEWTVQQVEKGRTKVKGISARVTWLGGFRAAQVNVEESILRDQTIYRDDNGFPEQLSDYFRTDLRFYLKWNKTGRSSTLSLDIQNMSNRRNEAFFYYDSVQQKVAVKEQLGIIPLMSYRVEF